MAAGASEADELEAAWARCRSAPTCRQIEHPPGARQSTSANGTGAVVWSREGQPSSASIFIGVAVVARDQRHAALALERRQHLGHAESTASGGHGGRDDARMAHHVGVREVHDVDVGLVRVDGRGQRGSHVRLAHLRLQVVGGNLGAGDERAHLGRLGLLAPAVQEERHVGVLLRLGDVVLAQARFSQHVSQHVVGELRGYATGAGSRDRTRSGTRSSPAGTRRDRSPRTRGPPARA